MMYSNYHWGMNLIWWCVWLGLLFLIFAIPYDIPGQRKKNTPLEILQKRFAAGEITNNECQEKKKIPKSDILKLN